ncbi:AraC family transcriptional regulator [Paracoccus sp. (in: a-proteobacteria)]|uniref:AraC family transcriptional regulator n=1 Tax=Paracoccus sp. TaxID=267 RepID=UPI0035AF068E
MDRRQLWRRSDSLEEFEATMSGLLRPCRVEGRARTRYRTEVLHGRLDRVGLTTVSLGGAAQVRVSAEKGISLLQIPLRGGFSATDRRGGTLHFAQGIAAQLVGPDAPVRLDFQPGTRMLIVDLGPQHLDAIGGAALFSRIARDRPSVALTGEVAARMLRLLDFLLEDIEMQQGESGTEAGMEQALIAVIGALLDQGGARDGGPDPSPGLLRRAERFMSAHLDMDLTPALIAEAAGTSTRSLHRAFRSHRGVTPMVALKAMRLDRARADIEAGRIGTDGLTGLAMRCGFNHMGLFAADYRQRFGVLPSQAARKTGGAGFLQP